MEQPIVPTVTVRYTCTLCGVQDAPVSVPARLDPDAMNVVYWVEQVVGNAIGAHHRRRSPGCPARKISQVKLPAGRADDPNAWVGMPGLQ